MPTENGPFVPKGRATRRVAMAIGSPNPWGTTLSLARLVGWASLGIVGCIAGSVVASQSGGYNPFPLEEEATIAAGAASVVARLAYGAVYNLVTDYMRHRRGTTKPPE